MKTIQFFAIFFIGLALFSCRKKQKDVEIEFILVSGPSYCGEMTQANGSYVCPRQLRVVSSGASYVMDQPLDTSITNIPFWWTKKYIVTLEEQKNSCECVDLSFDVENDAYPTLNKPIVKIKKIKLKE
jgi:hypothetical protein